MELEILKYKNMSEQIETDMKLTEKQNEAYSRMAKGENVFITGPGGVGKTAVIKSFIKMYKQSKIMGVTSTTGISALLFGGVTLHSFLGIGLNLSVSTLVGK